MEGLPNLRGDNPALNVREQRISYIEKAIAHHVILKNSPGNNDFKES